MLILHRLLCHSFQSKYQKNETQPSGPSAVSSTDPEKSLAVVVWWAAFGVSLFFQPGLEFITRALLVSIVALLLGALDGFLSLALGNAILASARSPGYDVSVHGSMEAGVLGGIAVIGPAILLVVLAPMPLALRGDARRHLAEPRLLAASVVLEVCLSAAVAATGSLTGVVIVGRTNRGADVLDASRAARAGALGAVVITVPVVCIAAVFSRGRAAQEDKSTAAPESAFLPSIQPTFQHRVSEVARSSVPVPTAIKITYYSLTILCILTLRFLCF